MSLLSKRNIKKKGIKQMNRPHSITHAHTVQANRQLFGGEHILKSHGQRSMVGYGPWGCKEMDTVAKQLNAYAHVL